ncbi:MAG: hypothetical protein ACJAYF_002779 [Arenicella sp.]|jgi:hypothetical protein
MLLLEKFIAYRNLSAKITLGDDMQITKSDKQHLQQAIAELKQEHRNLDLTIQNMAKNFNAHTLEVGRLKRQKLKLKDAIAKLESDLIPNLHA